MKSIKTFIMEAKAPKIDDNFKKIIQEAIKNGCIQLIDEKNKYGFSEENIDVLLDSWNNNNKPNDQIEEHEFHKYIDYLIKTEGYTWKYKTNKEWQQAGLDDPSEAN